MISVTCVFSRFSRKKSIFLFFCLLSLLSTFRSYFWKVKWRLLFNSLPSFRLIFCVIVFYRLDEKGGSFLYIIIAPFSSIPFIPSSTQNVTITRNDFCFSILPLLSSYNSYSSMFYFLLSLYSISSPKISYYVYHTVRIVSQMCHLSSFLSSLFPNLNFLF